MSSATDPGVEKIEDRRRRLGCRSGVTGNLCTIQQAAILAMEDAELALGLSTPEGMKALFDKMSKLATSDDPITRASDEHGGE